MNENRRRFLFTHFIIYDSRWVRESYLKRLLLFFVVVVVDVLAAAAKYINEESKIKTELKLVSRFDDRLKINKFGFCHFTYDDCLTCHRYVLKFSHG